MCNGTPPPRSNPSDPFPLLPCLTTILPLFRPMCCSAVPLFPYSPVPTALLFPRSLVLLFPRSHVHIPLVPSLILPRLTSRFPQPLAQGPANMTDRRPPCGGSVHLLLPPPPPPYSLFNPPHIMPCNVHLPQFLRRLLSASSPRRLIYPYYYPLRLWMNRLYTTYPHTLSVQ